MKLIFKNFVGPWTIKSRRNKIFTATWKSNEFNNIDTRKKRCQGHVGKLVTAEMNQQRDVIVSCVGVFFLVADINQTPPCPIAVQLVLRLQLQLLVCCFTFKYYFWPIE